MLEGNIRESALKRLKRAAGQVQGIQRMMEEGRYCIDVLRQIEAVEAALHSVGQLILRNHMETCVKDTFESKGASQRKEKIDELIEVFRGMHA